MSHILCLICSKSPSPALQWGQSSEVRMAGWGPERCLHFLLSHSFSTISSLSCSLHPGCTLMGNMVYLWQIWVDFYPSPSSVSCCRGEEAFLGLHAPWNVHTCFLTWRQRVTYPLNPDMLSFAWSLFLFFSHMTYLTHPSSFSLWLFVYSTSHF